MTIYQDYGYGSSYDAITTGFGILTGFFVYFIVMLVVVLAVSVVVCIALWKIFKKTGNPGWYALIPIFNLWKFFEISGLPGWLALIPLANGVGMLIACYKIAIKFGKSNGFAVCTIFFPMVCLPIIAFGKAVYGNVDNSMNLSDNNSIAMNNNVQPMVSNNIQPVVNGVQGNNVISSVGTSTSFSESKPADVLNTTNNMENQIVNNSIDNQPVNNNIQSSVSNSVEQNPNTRVNNVNPQNIVTNNTNNNVSDDGIVDNSVKICSNCQNANSSLSKFCAKCGHNL